MLKEAGGRRQEEAPVTRQDHVYPGNRAGKLTTQGYMGLVCVCWLQRSLIGACDATLKAWKFNFSIVGAKPKDRGSPRCLLPVREEGFVFW